MDGRPLLTFATLVLCIGFAQPLLFPRWPVPARAVFGLSTRAVATLPVALFFGSPLRPEFRSGADWSLAWQQAVEVGWWLAAARSLAGMARLFLVLHSRSCVAHIDPQIQRPWDFWVEEARANRDC